MSDTQISPEITSQAQPTHRIGGSVLPASDPRILLPMPGAHGTFQVRPLPNRGTYGLFLDDEQLLVTHPTGHLCHCLAERILKAWAGTGTVEHAMAQFDFILRCGGMGRSRAIILFFARGMKHEATPA